MNKNDQNNKGSCYTMTYFFPRITKIRRGQGPIDTTTRQRPDVVVPIAHTTESIEHKDTTTRQRPDVVVPIAHTTESMGTTGYKSKRRCQDQDHISVDYPVSKACCKGFVKLTDFSCYTSSLMIDQDIIVTKTRNETGVHISIKKLKFQMFSLDLFMHEPFFERQPLKYRNCMQLN
jgi:hypothetical protein